MVGNPVKIKNFHFHSGLLSFLFLLCILAGLISCGGSGGHPDVDEIKIDLTTQRLDRDLAAVDTNNLEAGLQQLSAKYPLFFNFYLDTLMGFGVNGNYAASNPAIQSGLRPFLSHPDIRGLFDTVAVHFPDTKKSDEELRKGFQYLKHYYPSHHIPKIVYFISGLNQWSAITYDTIIVGVGLDMFLGPQYPFYAAVQLPQYVINKCRPEYIPVNVFQAIYRGKHPFVMEGRTLLDMMIQRGKEQYFLERIIPFVNAHMRFGFSEEELEWCESNEAGIYNFFVTQNLLYETNWQKIVRYVNDGPNATGMPPESPGNIGSWVGYRIVKAFLEQRPETGMEELFRYEDAQRMLQESKYKPK